MAAEDEDDTCCVQVAVRVRPLLPLEGDDESCVSVLLSADATTNTQSIQIGGSQGPRFTFDHVFDESTPQPELYQNRVAPLVRSCLEGYNATILAYGQTGSGKTHTIMGEKITTTVTDDPEAGVIPRAFEDIFQSLQAKKQAALDDTNNCNYDSLEYQVSVQFLELYGEEIRDLLTSHRSMGDNNKLTIRDLGTAEPEVVGATQQRVQSPAEALQCLAHGMLRRVTGATAMNESSSRSHAILSVCIEQSTILRSNNENSSPDDEPDNEQHVQVTRSKFSCVDLAGAERVKRTNASGRRLQEGIDINKGLLALGSVVSCLGDPAKRGRTHVPYRDSKLTRLLKGSLGGNHKTLMIACVSPAAANMGESLNCLRYANRARNIQNKAVVNVDANTRRVQELQGQVKALATDLLKAMDGDTSSTQFTREVLASLADGNTSSLGFTPVKAQKQKSPEKNTPDGASDDRKLQETESELRRTQDLLRQSQNNHDAAELELQAVRAQNTWCDVQIATLTQESGPLTTEAVGQAFQERALEYEQEISQLRETLRDTQSRASRWRAAGPMEMEIDGNDDEIDIEQEEARLGKGQDRLMQIRAALSLDETLNDDIEADEKRQQAEIDHLTKKYLLADEEGLAEDGSGLLVGEDGDPAATEPALMMPPSVLQEPAQLTLAELDNLSHNIATKERLINQIKRNKEREAKMKEFYEAKLKEMEASLAEREREREQLLQDLEKATGRTTRSSERLKARLEEKEEQIAALKRMQENFRKQTAAAKRKVADQENLNQLQHDVKLMKRRKADLQKELASEKRDHVKDVNKLNKVVMQKDREISKIQRVSNRHEMEAEKAKQVSKSRLEELAHLKKTLKSYKRSAGLDPVLVGRRETTRNSSLKSDQSQKDRDSMSSIDADLVRDYFDKKVAHVVRKEALVDKLAKEWEQYFELNSQLNELTNAPETEDSNDALQTLEVQLQFQNDKIRKLAKRLGRESLSSGTTNAAEFSNESDTFLFDKVFFDLCSGHTPDLSRSKAAKVLFGMIVRERRRVAALAKTASSLDDRLHAAEKAVEVSEASLRSYIEEHRQEVVELAQTHQDHILSLMDMVKVESDTATGPSEEKFQKKLLVLANERVSLLEDELSEMRAEKLEVEQYAVQLDELKESLDAKTTECEQLEETRNNLRTLLRQLRDEALKYQGVSSDYGGDLGSSVVRMVDDFLHPASPPKLPSKNGANTLDVPRRSLRSPRLKKHIELMQTSDSDSAPDEEDEDDIPEWSSNIMADLALIAEGKIPASLNSPKILVEASQLEQDTITGRSVVSSTINRGARRKKDPSQPKELSPPVAAPSYALSSSIGGLGCIDTNENDTLHSENDPHIYQSVFERLGSPSHFTGTQKERFQDHEAKRNQAAEEAADRVLHSILDEKDEDIGNNRAESVNEKTSASSRTEYVKQNVFDRLQKTTTLAAAVRQNETRESAPRISPASSADHATHPSKQETKNAISQSREPSTGSDIQSKLGPERSDAFRAGYSKQNVFDRLQKTTTQAAAVRQNQTLQPKGDSTVSQVAGAGEMEKRPSFEKARETVFDRLNKTTTEAYAKKTNRSTQDG